MGRGFFEDLRISPEPSLTRFENAGELGLMRLQVIPVVQNVLKERHCKSECWCPLVR